MILKILIILIILYLILVFRNINYWEQIWENSKKKDFVKWILCDKLIAKKFAEQNGFKVAKLIQFSEFPYQLKEPKGSYVIKPVDLCNSGGIYLMKNSVNLIDNKKYSFKDIQKNLVKIRSEIKQQYYMNNKMFNNLIPSTGYIIEELLLENNNLLNDYKCYAFQGKVWFIACTYNRKMENRKQTFNSVWMTRDWKPIPFSMIKKGYIYQKINKPKGLEQMIEKVENISSKLERHCRIDVYLKNGETYFGEFTFFGGAFLHTKICNNILGLLWKIYPDNFRKLENEIGILIPDIYKINFQNDLLQ